MKKNILINISIILFVILLGVSARLLPHPWNFTPLTAIALSLSVYLGWRYSIIGVIAIMLLSDIFIGVYDLPIMLSVYGSFVFSIILGTYIDRHKKQTILFGILGSSLFFFLITNLAVWEFGTMYPHSFLGLIESYTMAIPFFRNALLGDIFYTTIFFGVFEICIYFEQRFVKLLAWKKI